ncbi:MAG: aminodeoxychorismate synthase component I [Chitinivibrionales bacterium]|nr:aminodeoxychorismate synthase component I [Chitinivibrionales bacterium]
MADPLGCELLAGLIDTAETAVLLDTAVPAGKNSRSYLFTDPVVELSVNSPDRIRSLLKDIDKWSKTHWVAGYLSYEASYGLEERFIRTIDTRTVTNSPLAWFGIFTLPFIFDHRTGKWNRPLPHTGKSPPISPLSSAENSITPSIDYEEYNRCVTQIRQWIAAGHTYQVNFTFDTRFKSSDSPLMLYYRLRQSQQAGYCSFIKNSHGNIASFSPELFFSCRGRQITVKPMKGTAPRGRRSSEDRRIRSALARDPKNQSENVMIVDLLRNDLGKICTTGSVKVRKLFELETYYTLHQMTSTIQGTLKSSIRFSDIISHLFPCGSVTGAPKIRTMEIIRSLEKRDRGVYCGALGFVGPHNRAVFSVPIRTMEKKKGQELWQFGTGSGIVWDSKAPDEWKECTTKCEFLIRPKPEFEIFESILWNRRLCHLRDHRTRLRQSAGFFGYPFPGPAFDAAVKEITTRCSQEFPLKIRIFLSSRGDLRWDSSPLYSSPNHSSLLLLSPDATNRNNMFLFHKTTYRPWYNTAMELIREGKCFDAAFFNEKNELTEGARSTIFIKKDNELFTPLLDCGLLPGTVRSRLIKSGKCSEKILYKKDLSSSDAVYCGNAIRGIVKVRIVDEDNRL